MRISPPADFRFAIEMYYGKVELTTEDICKLFNNCSRSSAIKLKKIAQEVMTAEGKLPWNRNNVLTETAYKAWHINVADLEKRLTKLAKLNF